MPKPPSTKQPKVTRHLIWQARLLMVQRNIRSVSELVRRLEAIGISISVAQLGRLIDGKNKLWNQEAIEGLLSIFDCELSDLLVSVPIPDRQD